MPASWPRHDGQNRPARQPRDYGSGPAESTSAGTCRVSGGWSTRRPASNCPWFESVSGARELDTSARRCAFPTAGQAIPSSGWRPRVGRLRSVGTEPAHRRLACTRRSFCRRSSRACIDPRPASSGHEKVRAVQADDGSGSTSWCRRGGNLERQREVEVIAPLVITTPTLKRPRRGLCSIHTDPLALDDDSRRRSALRACELRAAQRAEARRAERQHDECEREDEHGGRQHRADFHRISKPQVRRGTGTTTITSRWPWRT